METKMNKQFEKANDQHLRAVYFYGNADNALYYGPSFLTKVTKSDAEYAFELGALNVVVDDVTYRPVYMDGNSVAIVTASGTVQYTTEED